ncbi:MAG: hypothetical protein H6624_08270 [Bdellovibrionaceae bacterium]|nr:hypothetical protein [Bdellovibrionales bacterium]MCB9084327.1 hypothetical protein [Pseudobdellovibrionaceae bacterium]
MKRNSKYLIGTIAFLSLTLGLFQNCTNSKLRFKNFQSSAKQMEGASGHGSGYDGKLDPGLLVQQDPSQTCFLKDGTPTHVKSIIRVHSEGNLSYSDNCREENPQNIDSKDVIFLYESVVVFGGDLYRAEEKVPTNEEPRPHLLGTCMFRELEEPIQGGALLNVQVNVLEENGNPFVETIIEEVEGNGPHIVEFEPAEPSVFEDKLDWLKLLVDSFNYELNIYHDRLKQKPVELTILVRGSERRVLAERQDACFFP